MDHIDVFPRRAPAHQKNAFSLGRLEARRTPLLNSEKAAWIMMEEPFGLPNEHTLAVVTCPSRTCGLFDKIEAHYTNKSNGNRRWKRVAEVPFWLYLDLCTLFARWNRVWDAAREVVIHHEAVSSPISIISIHQQFAGSSRTCPARPHRSASSFFALRYCNKHRP
jgi:hypothetical protein